MSVAEYSTRSIQIEKSQGVEHPGFVNGQPAISAAAFSRLESSPAIAPRC